MLSIDSVLFNPWEAFIIVALHCSMFIKRVVYHFSILWVIPILLLLMLMCLLVMVKVLFFNLVLDFIFFENLDDLID